MDQGLCYKRDREIGGRDAVQAITEMLDDKVGAARIAAIEAMERLGDKKIGGRIISMLNDKDADVRLAAIKTLGQLRVEGGKEALKDLVRTENDPAVRNMQKRCWGNFNLPVGRQGQMGMKGANA